MLHDYIVGLASRALEVFPTEGKIAAVSGKLAAERDALKAKILSQFSEILGDPV